MERGLADTDGRVRIDGGKAHMLRDLFGGRDGHVGDAGRGSVRDGQLQGTLVNVDRPHIRLGRLTGEGDGDRAVAAAEVKDLAALRWMRSLFEQDQSPQVDTSG